MNPDKQKRLESKGWKVGTADDFLMKTRRHHNNNGLRQIKNGKTRKDAERLRKEICDKSCPEHKKMGVYACSDRTQCFETCGDLGKDEKHIKVSDIKALPRIDY